jgi:hypothetical protein
VCGGGCLLAQVRRTMERRTDFCRERIQALRL